ncbi:hypothetical protein SAMN05444007_1292 [Cribrihabitans marinus]|uniref:Uncharacterized protein n=1 Tax=Cribrihabitans marinus TaxID=1227549 RepID=A0A1H7E3R4_9RHOB|nr:hypothetical protein [Cribrihabitans marinus]GGH41539.1 hypothetical protein GCM10010973_38530 [Cribrihabitans marinus]SEK08488.1 hypothetical protein SAMN05444007_1292 [Cribrihabitans marinus]
MAENLDSVKQVIADLKTWSDQNREAGRESVSQKFDALVPPLEWAVQRIVDLEALTSALPPDLGNIHDLPQELRDELSIAKTDELEDQIVTVINAYGGEASLDQILVGLYRKFKVTQKRRFVQNKLYRMSMVWSVEGRKGVYTTDEKKMSREDSKDEVINSGGADSKTHSWDDEIPF